MKPNPGRYPVAITFITPKGTQAIELEATVKSKKAYVRLFYPIGPQTTKALDIQLEFHHLKLQDGDQVKLIYDRPIRVSAATLEILGK